jgi:hypothetical protein
MLLPGGTNLQGATRGYSPGVGLPPMLQYGFGGSPYSMGSMGSMGSSFGQNPFGSYVSSPMSSMFGSNPFYNPALGGMRPFAPMNQKSLKGEDNLKKGFNGNTDTL